MCEQPQESPIPKIIIKNAPKQSRYVSNKQISKQSPLLPPLLPEQYAWNKQPPAELPQKIYVE